VLDSTPYGTILDRGGGMEIVAVTALVCVTVYAVARLVNTEVREQRISRKHGVMASFEMLKAAWDDTLTAILTEVDFSFSPRLVVEVGGVQAAVAEKGITTEDLPLEVRAFIAKDSSSEAREDLVKSAYALRNSEEGGMEWDKVVKGLETEVEERGW